MPLSRLCSVFLILCASLCLNACGGGNGTSAPAPTGGITATPGNNQVTLNWTADPDVTYWILYTTGSSVSTDDIPAIHTWIPNVTPPYTITGLTNGTTYAFTVNGRKNGGPGGSGAPSQSTTPRPAGVSGSWASGSGLGSSTINGLTYGTASDSSTNYLAVGSAGALYRATDGKAWSAITTGPVGVNFNATLYANSQYIAAGATGSIYTSSDLAIWTLRTSNTSNNLNALANNGSLSVAVGDAGTVRSSSDGVTWSAAASVPTNQALYGVGYFNGLWVAVGAGGTVLTSSDANTWTAATSGTSNDLRGIAGVQLSSGSNIYVAVGANGSLLTSSDASAWSLKTVGSNTLYAINASATQLIAVGANGSVLTSSEGIAWTAQTSGSSANLLCLYGSPSQYFAAGATGTTLTSQ